MPQWNDIHQIQVHAMMNESQGKTIDPQQWVRWPFLTPTIWCHLESNHPMEKDSWPRTLILWYHDVRIRIYVLRIISNRAFFRSLFSYLLHICLVSFSIYSSPWNFFSSRLDRRIRLDLITVLFAQVSFPIFCWSSGVSVPILYPVYSLYSLDRLCLSRNLPTRTLAQTTLTLDCIHVL